MRPKIFGAQINFGTTPSSITQIILELCKVVNLKAVVRGQWSVIELDSDSYWQIGSGKFGSFDCLVFERNYAAPRHLPLDNNWVL